VESQSGHVFTVEDIITKERSAVHAERMKLYCDSSLNVTEQIKLQKAFDDESFIIEKILQIKNDQVLIKWKGFSDLENSWEPIETVRSDAPKLLENFLQTQEDRSQKVLKRKRSMECNPRSQPEQHRVVTGSRSCSPDRKKKQ